MIIDWDKYKERDVKISISKINLLSLAMLLLLIVPAHFLYYYQSAELKLNYLHLFLLIILGIVLHELIHAIVAVKYADRGWKTIKFGVLWKYGAFYCHCTEALTVTQYRKVVVMPTIVTAVFFVVSLFTLDWTFTFFTIAMIAGGSGDMAILYTLRNERADALVRDYQDKIGAAILEPI